MVRTFAALLLVLACAAGCRTEIKPVVRDTTPPKRFFSAPGQGCQVNDFTAATDVPAGAKNLGWVEVQKEAEDEATYKKLREAICAMGGNGLSQLSWVREAGEYEPSKLKANAWALPP